MVTFNCEVCNDTVPKKNSDKHYNRCPQAYYTCIDCYKTFDDGFSHKKHNQCITEDEKYQKSLFKGKKKSTLIKGESVVVPLEKFASSATPKRDSSQHSDKQTKVDDRKKSSNKKSSTDFKPPSLKRGVTLYKILKGMDSKVSKKELLKRLVVVDEAGKLEFKK